jgi:DNA-binding transcriptional LysR family regulator
MRSEDLRYFLAVASAGKLGTASDLLGISQPGLTKAIGRLESELGGTLFRRTGRGMELTELGLSFEQHARRMTAELDRAMAAARAFNPQEGVIRLGVAPVLEPLVLELIAAFVRQRPLVRFELMVQITDYLELGLSGGRIDLAVASESGLFAEELAFQPLAHDEVRIAAPVDHPLAERQRRHGPLKLADLVPHDWALPNSDIAMRRYLVETFRAQGLPEPVARIENEYGSGIFALAARAGLLTLCNPYVFRRAPAGSLVTLALQDFTWRRRVGLLTRRGFPLTPVTADFIQQLVSQPNADLLF